MPKAAVRKSIERWRVRGRTWLGMVRLRVFVLVIGAPLAIFGAISIGPAWLALPLVGVAVAAVSVTWNRLTAGLGEHICWTCGADLKGQPQGVHGVVCEKCGSLNQHNPPWKNELMALDDAGAEEAPDENARA
ncbi:MAG: hypothetical protein J0L61_06735 [Planctomycetes bacterium]|nr:hypothetical protein [Planctomycetota bacterium]